MLEKFYGFKHDPFSRDIPTDLRYLAAMTTEILTRPSYGAKKQLFTVLTGDCGSVKIRIILKLKESLEESKCRLL